jgi:hypothetical protein
MFLQHGRADTGRDKLGLGSGFSLATPDERAVTSVLTTRASTHDDGRLAFWRHAGVPNA